MAMRLRQRVRQFAYAHGFGIDELAEQRVLDGGAGVPPGSLVDGKLMAVQVAKNSFTPDEDLEAVKRDYVYCVEALARYADIIVVNGKPLWPNVGSAERLSPRNSLKSEYPGSKRSTARRQIDEYSHWRCRGVQESKQEDDTFCNGYVFSDPLSLPSFCPLRHQTCLKAGSSRIYFVHR